VDSEERFRRRSTRSVWIFGRGRYTSAAQGEAEDADAHLELGELALEKRARELGGAHDVGVGH
jgi:hypothetical protein